jgi:hypothetical protein
LWTHTLHNSKQSLAVQAMLSASPAFQPKSTAKVYPFRRLYYSFPLRLLALHLRNHVILIGLWVSLGAFSSGLAGRFFGMHYLMLTPEYLGSVGILSFFLTGAAFGAFCMIWNLTTYLLSADRFPFLATLDAPFTKFCINNSLLPLAFLLLYLSATIWFQWHDELTKHWDILLNVAGFVSGMATLICILALYLYFTNKDIATFLRPGGKFYPKPGGKLLIKGQRIPTLLEIQSGATRWRVDTYLSERGHVRLVRSVAHYPQEMLQEVFRQNHFNAVAVQLIALMLLVWLGIYMDRDWARIPTAATIFILGSIFMSVFGAVSYWFRKWSLLVFLILLFIINLLTGMGFMNYRNKAYGLNYSCSSRVPYNYAYFEGLCTPKKIAQDKAAIIHILENWLRKNQTAQNPKPKMLFICVSGGGMRSAAWTTQCLQQVDKASRGKLLQQTALITGASGGMLGAAYIREALLRKRSDAETDIYSPQLFENITKDLLNPITFGIAANDLFYPWTTFEYGGQEYRQDRGYLLERQLLENTDGFLGRKIAEYRKPERDASIPMMIVSPFVLNDGRRLLISPQGTSYLMKPPAQRPLASQLEIDGIDFGAMFQDYQSDSLAISSALRMNCTYPLILPNVWLPTEPAVEVLDAGLRDNYGMGLAVRFIQNFEDWIKENTGGVILVEMRCWAKVESISQSNRKGVIENLFSPADAVANITTMQDYDQDADVALLQGILGRNMLQAVHFYYRPVRKQREASMSLHLSRREKIDISEAFFSPDNKANLRALIEMLR